MVVEGASDQLAVKYMQKAGGILGFIKPLLKFVSMRDREERGGKRERD